MSASQSSDLLKKQALDYFAQGNFNQTIACLKKIPDAQTDAEIQKLMLLCLQKLARKYWRQDKPQEFDQIIKQLGPQKHLELAYARLKGKDALEKLTTSTDITSKLAWCYLQADTDLKTALLTLRQEPNLKLMAEGWLALLKGDHERAMQSFQNAEAANPLSAKIGQGVVCLVQKNYKLAQNLLEPLHSFASRRFPHLAKVMGWDGIGNHSFCLSYYLTQATLEEIIEAEKKCPPQQKELKGWLWLKIGDHLSQKSIPEAIAAWKKAYDFHPCLKLDYYKRRYLSGYMKDSTIDLREAWMEFYCELSARNPNQARSFIEYLVFDSQRPIQAFLHYKDFLNKKKRWALNPTPIELKLLWLTLAYRHTIKNLTSVLALSKKIDSVCDLNLQEWEQLFVELDPSYSQKEGYLLQKLALFRLMQQPIQAKDTAKKLLTISPHLKEEILPIYIRAMLHLHQWLRFDASKEKHYEDIESLRRAFPSDFDLIRLSILFNPQRKRMEGHLSDFATQISEPLFSVLRVQLLVDWQKGITSCRKAMPPPNLLGKNQEADWRLVSALATPALKFPKKELQKLIEQLTPNSATKYEFFTKMLQHYGYPPPFSTLNKWSKSNFRDWRPSYLFALYYEHHENLNQCLRNVFDARDLINECEPEFPILNKTIDHHGFRFTSPMESMDFDAFIHSIEKRMKGR